jgi:sugar lactone lactonase YvrE
VQACLDYAKGGVARICTVRAVGVQSVPAVRGLLEARLGNSGDGGGHRRTVLDGFFFLRNWWRANGEWEGFSREDIKGLLALMDLRKLAKKELRDIVCPTGMVELQHLVDILKENEVTLGEGLFLGEYHLSRTLGSKGNGPGQFKSITSIAVHGEREQRRIACVDDERCRVLVFDAWNGRCVASVGSDLFTRPSCVAFNRAGELYVSDSGKHTIFIFDTAGNYLHDFGQQGSEEGRFDEPEGLAFTPEGQLVVCDQGNNRVQVLQVVNDDDFIAIVTCMFGTRGDGEGMFNHPTGVAVGADGSIAVGDGNGRVQVFDEEGTFLVSVGDDLQTGNLGIAVTSEGDIVVTDWEFDEVHVLSIEGEYVHTLDVKTPYGIAVDADGRLFVACNDGGHVKVLF